MADDVTFPTMPAKQWWVLRSKFKQKIPATVTLDYLATALDMRAQSARANIFPTLVRLKIIDQDGKPTERARAWRDDQQYPKVCEEMREEAYPIELLDALPPPSPDRGATERWFQNRIGVGEAASRRMAVVYEILCEANPASGQEAVANSGTITVRKRPTIVVGRSAKTTVLNKQVPMSELAEKPETASSQVVPRTTPSLHIDVQIHISPDATPAQIDQIFASMAKHLYGQAAQDGKQSD